jgi:crotonobetainyl-CoA:carnitine CoA-transferase CaiB-like acyl-CoA transferase
MNRALDGIRVVDLTVEFWGSVGAALLADFGADVVRIDAIGSAAAVGPEPERAHGAWNALAELAQRNKQSLAVDLTSARGRELVRDLVAKADVVITDRGRKDLQALGLD